jgi:hypothetical protein
VTEEAMKRKPRVRISGMWEAKPAQPEQEARMLSLNQDVPWFVPRDAKIRSINYKSRKEYKIPLVIPRAVYCDDDSCSALVMPRKSRRLLPIFL